MIHIATIRDLVDSLTGDTSPKLTWYGNDQERIELSGHVLANWAIKTSNLFSQESLVEPDSNTVLDLPVHWRAIAIGLGIWTLGGSITPSESEPATDRADSSSAATVVTTKPQTWTAFQGAIVAVSLPALSRRFEGSLRPDDLDYSAEVLAMSDALEPRSTQSETSIAIRLHERAVRFGDLVSSSFSDVSGPTVGAPQRVLVQTDDVTKALTDCTAILFRGGSVVLASASTHLSTRSLLAEGLTQP